MNEPDEDPDVARSVEARVRAALEADQRAPPAAVRTAILEHARALAADRTRTPAPLPESLSQPDQIEPAGRTVNDPIWRLTAVAAVALLAALVAWPLLESSNRAARVATQPRLEPPPQIGADMADRESTHPSAHDAERRLLPAQAAPTNTTPARQDEPVATHAGTASGTPETADGDGQRVPAQHVPPAASSAVADLPRSARAARSVAASRESLAPSQTPPLVQAVLSGDPERVRDIMSKTTDLDSPDPSGRTPLIIATERNALPIVQMLLDRGADPNLADPSGETALGIADRLHYTTVARVLRQAGAHD